MYKLSEVIVPVIIATTLAGVFFYILLLPVRHLLGAQVHIALYIAFMLLFISGILQYVAKNVIW